MVYAMKKSIGFTLVEFIAVMVIASVLFVTLSARLSSNNASLIQAKSELISTLQRARYIALSRAETDSDIAVIVSATTLDLRENTSSADFPDIHYPLALPANVRITQGLGIINFDRLGNTVTTTIELTDEINIQQINLSSGGYVY